MDYRRYVELIIKNKNPDKSEFSRYVEPKLTFKILRKNYFVKN